MASGLAGDPFEAMYEPETTIGKTVKDYENEIHDILWPVERVTPEEMNRQYPPITINLERLPPVRIVDGFGWRHGPGAEGQ